MSETPEFDYSNLNDRPVGYFVRLTSKILPGVRKVQDQVVPYATAWNKANLQALQQDGPLWVVLGDSMSQGIGASAYNRGYVGQLHEMLDTAGKQYRILNLSVSGCRVRDVLDRQIPTMEQLNVSPDLVTVLIGSNDMVSKKYRVNLADTYTEMLEKLPHGTVIASPFGDFGIGKAMNALIKAEAQKHGFVLVENDLGTGLSSWKGKLAEDHFHPNDTGYAGLAQVFYNAIMA